MTTTSLTEAQGDLLRETERERLAALDEDELLDLHQRVRRARNKHVGLYRRQASARVATKGGRGVARPANRLNADRAEAFELALARVSTRLGAVARAAAAELRTERLTAAREARMGTGPDAHALDGAKASVPSTRRRATKTTGGLKRDASSRSAGARRQSAKDAR